MLFAFDKSKPTQGMLFFEESFPVLWNGAGRRVILRRS